MIDQAGSLVIATYDAPLVPGIGRIPTGVHQDWWISAFALPIPGPATIAVHAAATIAVSHHSGRQLRVRQTWSRGYGRARTPPSGDEERHAADLDRRHP